MQNETEPVAGVALAPLLAVRGGARAVAFYKAAFGATEIFRIDSPDGAVVAQLGAHGATFWLSDESPTHGISPESLGGGTVRLILTVPDPEASFARAVDAGAASVYPVAETHGWLIQGAR